MKCYQRIIRENLAEECPRETLMSTHGLKVKEITIAQAGKIIFGYEWLGTLGRPMACYGLWSKNELIGAVTFGLPGSHRSRLICGAELYPKAICLERGACVHWAPKNAATFFISRAVKMARQTYGWEIFFAYSDEDAGEIGTIYQALNWYYIGKGVGRRRNRNREYFIDADGNAISERTLTERKLRKTEVIKLGWTVVFKSSKHKYVWFEGSRLRKKYLKGKCKYSFHAYPKRIHIIDKDNC